MSCLQESQLARFHQELAVARSFSGKHYDDDDAFEDDDGEAYEDEDEPPATDHREEHLGRMSEIGRATGQCTVVTSAFQYLDSYCLTRCIIIIIQSFPIPLPGSGWKKDSQSTRVHECKVSILRTQSNSPTILSHGLVHMPPGPDCHLHMRRLRHLRMPTSLVHARTSATSLVHAHTFLAVFVGIKLRIWSFGFRVLGVSGFSGFRGGVVMT